MLKTIFLYISTYVDISTLSHLTWVYYNTFYITLSRLYFRIVPTVFVFAHLNICRRFIFPYKEGDNSLQHRHTIPKNLRSFIQPKMYLWYKIL